MSDFSVLNWTNLRSFQGRYGYRLAVNRQKLHLKCFASLVDVYHRPDIARFEPLSGNALLQDHAIMLFHHKCARLDRLTPVAF